MMTDKDVCFANGWSIQRSCGQIQNLYEFLENGVFRMQPIHDPNSLRPAVIFTDYESPHLRFFRICKKNKWPKIKLRKI